MTLTQGRVCGIDLHKFACLHDDVGTPDPNTTKRKSYIALVILITWLAFGDVLLETVILPNFR